MAVVERTVEVRNRHGLHARPAAEFVKLASSFESRVEVEKEGLEVNGKSIMGVLMLAAEPGSILTVRAEGEDAESAVSALVEFVQSDEGLADDTGEPDGESAAELEGTG